MANNDEYDAKLKLLEKIVSDGITRLLTEASQNNYLEEPYGRAPAPTPLITEEEFVTAGGVSSCLPDEPEFKFDYGFDPLEYLSKFITWSHPDSVQRREQDKQDAVAALTNRAKHAHYQLDTSVSLKEVVLQLRSGIFWGPVVSPVPTKIDTVALLAQKNADKNASLPSSSVIVMCKPFKLGFVTFQLSEHADFSVIDHSVCKPVQIRNSSSAKMDFDLSTVTEVSEVHDHENELSRGGHLEDIIPVKVVISGLKFGTHYFCRCYLTDTDTTPVVLKDDEDYDVDVSDAPVEVPYFQESKFWTLPSEELVPETNSNLDQSSGFHGSFSTTSLHRNDSYQAPSIPDVSNAVEGTIDISCTPLSLLCFGQILPQKKVYSKPKKEEGNEQKIVLFEHDSAVDNSVVPYYSCILGDLMYNGVTENIDNAAATTNTLSKPSQCDVRVSRIYAKTPLFNNALSSIMRNTCVLYSHRDSSEGSRRFLNSEEVVHRQYRHDLRRYNKKYNIATDKKDKEKERRRSSVAAANGNSKDSAVVQLLPPAPTLKRLALCDSMQTLFELFPVDFTEDYDPLLPAAVPTNKPKKVLTKQQQEKEAAEAAALAAIVPKGTRMLYRTYMLGPDIQVIVLDMRGAADEGGAAYLGKEQSEWLKNTLLDSVSLWKVILCGYSFGLVGVSNIDAVWTQSPESAPPSAQGGNRRMSGVLRHSSPNIADPAFLLNLTGTNPPNKVIAEKGDAENGVPPPPAETDSPIGEPGKLTSSRSMKQFKLQEPAESDKPLIDEDLEEVYLRSKHSLPYILATVQTEKYNATALQHLTKPTTPNIGTSPPTAVSSVSNDINDEQDSDFKHMLVEPSLPEVSLSSGIVVLTSGIARVVRPGTALKAPHHGDIIRETSTPAFITAYNTLSGVADTDHKLLTSSSATESAVLTDHSTLPFCAEVGLGSYSESRVLKSEGGGVAKMKFGYLAGFDANTLYTSLTVDDKTKVNGNTATNTANVTTACQLSLSIDGALDIKVIETDLSPPGIRPAGEVPKGVTLPGRIVYECKLRSHLLSPLEEQSEASLA